MANENKKSNELVSDEDSTDELDAVTFPQHRPVREHLLSESDEHTHDFADHGGKNSQTISKLQYDIEQLRAKWLGLETELHAREELTDKLNTELAEMRDALGRKEKLLRTRDQKIKALKAEIRERDEQHRSVTDELREDIENTRKLMREIPEPPPQEQATTEIHIDEDRVARTEKYADLLRRKMQDLLTMQDAVEKERDRLSLVLAATAERNRELTDELAAMSEARDQLEEELSSISDAHAEEIRILRFELGDAQDTVAQTEELNTQLASDLVDTRGFKEELERMLCENDEQSKARIDKLEGDLTKMSRTAEELEEKLEARSDAINVLLAELARKSAKMDSVGDIDDVISDIDDHIAEQFDEPDDARAQRKEERVTRVLVGKIGEKLLRFPLFKDRLTIGRSDDNDIQLNASYISRRHAVVQTDGDTTRLIDWGSKNGVYVNSTRVTEHFLQNGDIVSIGNAHFRYDERPKRDG